MSSCQEDDEHLTLRVKRTEGSFGAISCHYETIEGSAMEGVDFQRAEVAHLRLGVIDTCPKPCDAFQLSAFRIFSSCAARFEGRFVRSFWWRVVGMLFKGLLNFANGEDMQSISVSIRRLSPLQKAFHAVATYFAAPGNLIQKTGGNHCV
eukprot:4724225-Amphidinium_carterae.2